MISKLERMKRPILVRLAMIPALLCAVPFQAFAGPTNISNAPFTVEGASPAKPNVMFIMDDSGSMARSNMPDSVDDDFRGKYGYVSSQCNGVYYNPNIKYLPPKNHDGSSYDDAKFNSALYDGYNSGSATVNLGSSFRAYDNNNSGGNDSAQAAYYYKYTGTQTVKDYRNTINHPKKGPKSTENGVDFWEECASSFGSAPGKDVFTKVNVATGTAEEKQNFANWYSYYRTRMLTMKSGAGAAFSVLDSSMRVGLTTINYSGVDPTNAEFLNIADFDESHKKAWFEKFYKIGPADSTPLRAALSKVGRIYAGKFSAGNPLYDPLQYWCQRNYSILSTDGFWNESDSAAVKMDGSSQVGNQDSANVRPYYEGPKATSNTLSDVAAYYYNSDLRPGPTCNTGALLADGTKANVCKNELAPRGVDTASHQHMTTYTVGLGVSGVMRYQGDYETASTGDYKDIIQGTKNWPVPAANDLTTVDDLWHAAVNGRGTYYSALNPSELSNGLSKALLSLKVSEGAGAAASTSNLEPVLNDNKAFTAEFRTVFWDGDLLARTVDLDTGLLTKESVWSAKKQLTGRVGAVTDTRKIYTFDPAGANNLRTFEPGSFTSTEKALWFNPKKLSQYGALDAFQELNATPDNLINYLRGQYGFENQIGVATAVPPIPDVPVKQRVFRDREVPLGDIVSSRPVHVRIPIVSWADDGFEKFKSSAAIQKRKGVVYVGANDGMLHAFERETGEELWAYVPTMVIPNMVALADYSYASNHRYFVDGSPTATDIFDGTNWKTIVVAGLGAGGRGYFALDVTDPENPKALWEFSAKDDPNLGLTFGTPAIAKLPDGTWAVFFGSGYNNGETQSNGDKNDPVGDGVGRLYVLDANTGKVLHALSTGVGDAATPSGMAKVTGWVDNGRVDNTIKRIYGGDLLGNMWRFDFDASLKPSEYKAFNLGNFKVAGVPQPITTRPELGLVGGEHTAVFFGTGRLVGTDDLSDTTQQSIYAVKDKIGSPSLGDARSNAVCPLVKQDLISVSTSSRTSTSNTVDWTTKCGWYVDLNPGSKSPGERVNVDPTLQLGVLAVASNVPSKDVCLAGGTSWLYFFDYRNGSFFATDPTKTVGTLLGNAIVVGISTYRAGDNTITNATLGSREQVGRAAPDAPGGGGGKRVSWRELFTR
jgi:type IV pilus assembly protein PilY1